MPSPAHSSIHPKRIKILQVARRQLDLTDDDWRALLSRSAGVDSSVDLDDGGFQLVMHELNRLGFKSTSARRGYGQRPGFASPAQVHAIRAKWAVYRGGEPDPDDATLNAWLTRYHHISALRFVTAEKARDILTALKAMVGRQPRLGTTIGRERGQT